MTQTIPNDFIPLSNLGFEVLVALGGGDRHGYAIIRDIEDRNSGLQAIRSGALYTALQRFLELGMIENAPTPDDGDTRRKYYRITPLGREVVALEGARLARMVEAARSRRLLTPSAS